MTDTPVVPVWQEVVGELPYRVVAAERLDKDRVVYLRCRLNGNWKWKSTKLTVRTASGRLIQARIDDVLALAERWRQELLGNLPAEERPAPTTRLTLKEGLALITHESRGKYKVDTPHRREVIRSLQHAIRILGEKRTWDSLKRGDLSEVWCTRIRELRAEGRDGFRGAEVIIRDVLAVGAWLRSREHIPATACVFDGRAIKEEIRTDWRQIAGQDRDHTPARPRHELEEFRRVLAVAPSVDPRFGLLLDAGAEGRLGQVRRSRRTDLDLERGKHGVLRVHGRGKKQGLAIHLTAGQRAAFDRALGLTDPAAGYLRILERAYIAGEIADYALFPAGQLKGSREGLGDGSKKSRPCPEKGYAALRHAEQPPVTMRRVLEWFVEAERRAGVPHQPGRGAYGLRRVAVDVAKESGISREGLQAHGGWSDTQIPDTIYAEQEQEYAREEAREVRARKIRGENANEGE